MRVLFVGSPCTAGTAASFVAVAVMPATQKPPGAAASASKQPREYADMTAHSAANSPVMVSKVRLSARGAIELQLVQCEAVAR